MHSALIRQIAQMGHQAPSADNTQPWRMEWDGAELGIFYDVARATGKTFPAESPATLLSIGALIENIISAATDRQLQPQLHLADNPGGGSKAFYAAVRFKHSEEVPASLEPQSGQVRHTNRGPFTSEPVPGSLTAELTKATQGTAHTWFSQDKAVRQQMAQVVKQASEIRFQTKEIHEWLGRSLRFSPDSVAQGDGLDVATLGLPPGGGMFLRLISDWNRMRALNALGLYKLVAAMDSGPIKAGPGLLAIIAPATPQNTIDAGRLLARQWGNLNAAGLAVHPYYVVADQLARLAAGNIPVGLEPLAGTVARQCQALMGITGDETLHMLLRVGFPKKSAKMALRLPLDQVYSDSVTQQY